MPTKPLTFPNLLTLTPLLASGNSIAPNLPTTSSAPYGIVLHVKFTLGSLTNCIITPQVLNPDGATWEPVYALGAASATGLTLTASGNAALFIAPFGCKQFRVAYTTSGATTSSQLIIDATALVIL